MLGRDGYPFFLVLQKLPEIRQSVHLTQDKLRVRKYHRFRASSNATLYRILGVEENASPKDIKAAFVRRSKELHPDRNKENKNAQQEFVKMLEAYRVLRSVTLRHEYDTALRQSVSEKAPSEEIPREAAERMHKEEDPSRTRYKGPIFAKAEYVPVGTANYYGINGFAKVSNKWMLGLCFLIALLGCLIHYGTYRLSVVLRRVDVEERSEKNAREYAKLRERVLSSDMDNVALLEKLAFSHEDNLKPSVIR
ncbi:dnaJ homolog subfamily C member 4-like [Paramacrobiotus metropolitanus]|uniref:dnaJ homolog subfamily C member 4-like n=1 Tax=Paramacrobiotus metropolitanus TaxID=2943436 RepID=UPI0024462AD9|nr:dnaJ homolog subfamily C member 4-like [Paramacrobiotus metropolitanus]